MSNFTFRPAVRENVGFLIGLSGPSGSGKTYSAMRLASGIAKFKEEKGFSLIDTENRRGLHYADKFTFKHIDLRAPFRPDAYAEKMIAEDKAGSPVIVTDSMSHEWSGDGGVLDWQEKEFERLQYKDNMKMVSWIKPKIGHKKFVTKILQVNAFLIFCLRAEPKIEMKKNQKTGKMEVVEKQISQVSYGGYVPICEKNFPYELTVSFMLTPEAPGVPKPVKLQEQHKAIFPLDKVLDEDAGYKIAEWASGGKAAPKQESQEPPPQESKAEDEKAGPKMLSLLMDYISELGLGPDEVREICSDACSREIRAKEDLSVAECEHLIHKFARMRTARKSSAEDVPI